MRLFYLKSRAVAVCLTAVATAALAVSSAPVQAAPAQGGPQWTKVATADNRIEWAVDAASVRREGAYVLSSVKVSYPYAIPSAINGQPSDYQIRERADDCAAGKSAVLSRVDYKASGAVVAKGASRTVAGAAFAPVARDRLDKAAHDFICSRAAGGGASATPPPPPPLVIQTVPKEDRATPAPKPAPKPTTPAAAPSSELRTGANLTPSIDVKGRADNDWTFLSRSEKGDLTVAVLDGSTQTSGSTVSVVVRTDYGAGDKLADGTAYRRDISRLSIDCAERKFGYVSSDYYDGQSRLVGVEQTKPGAAKEKIPPGSLVERLANLVCRKEPGRKSAQMAIYTGTGFLTAKGYIVTASHVVGGAKSVTIFRDGKKLGEADVVRDDPSNDVVVLKPRFDTAKFTALRLKPGPAVLGSRIFTLGYPLADELGFQTVKMAAGDVSSLTGVDYASRRIDDPRFLQISIPVQGGNSGGPVIDEDGEVIGIVSSKKERTADSELTQNVNFALKSSYITRLLVDLPPVGKYKLSTARGKVSTIVADVQSGVFLIWVERPRE